MSFERMFDRVRTMRFLSHPVFSVATTTVTGYGQKLDKEDSVANIRDRAAVQDHRRDVKGRDAVVEMALAQIEKQHGKGAIMRLGDLGPQATSRSSRRARWRWTWRWASADCRGAASSRSTVPREAVRRR